MTKILMSAETPNGFKLEELLLDVIADLRTKNRKLAGDTSDISRIIVENNHGAINHLVEALNLQRDTLARLDEIGPDQGPRGKPRIGVTEIDLGTPSPFTFYTGSASISEDGHYPNGAALHYQGMPIENLQNVSVENVVELGSITVSIIRFEVGNPTPVICGPAPKE